MVTAKPEGLKLPLKNHNYLIGMVFNACEAADAKAESKSIEEQRNRSRGDAAAADYLEQMKSNLTKSQS